MDMLLAGRQLVQKQQINAITQAIIGAAIEVHRELGPGLLEQPYEACLAFELLERGLELERQKTSASCLQGAAAGFQLSD
jgi:GxxExxY protein